ncbi:MAG TPA: FMN-binding protein [Coriobacteriia bacterium]
MLRLMWKLGLPTILICAVAAAGLAATYAVTKGPIAAQDKLAQERALKAVLTDAKSFRPLTDKTVLTAAGKAGGETPVDSIFEALDGGGAVVGWGVQVRPRGYGGPMTVVVGVDRNGKVTGVNMVAHNETPGLGTKAVGTVGKPTPYLATFKSVDSAEKALKLDGVTGATKSSRGVKHAVEAALLVYDRVLKEGGGAK